ncbi:MAG: response regulator, partial [Pseudomonadota bacterium]
MKDAATSPDAGRTLMVIDDNDIDRMMARRMANRSGIVERFLSFESAVDALEFLNSEQFQKVDVILLDGQMPKMDG